MASGYTDAFQTLLHVLTAITVLSAVIAFGLLGKTGQPEKKLSAARRTTARVEGAQF
ncbi:MAG TPA: hypothetical protein VGD54_06430 [Steroidobacteraceae bacterium]